MGWMEGGMEGGRDGGREGGVEGWGGRDGGSCNKVSVCVQKKQHCLKSTGATCTRRKCWSEIIKVRKQTTKVYYM